MIVFQNSFICLHYAPETDILSVDWPDVESKAFPEVKESLNKIIEVVKSYDVKFLLVDAGKGVISMPYHDYLEVIKEFAAQLRQTRLQKFARIITSDPEREITVNSVRKEVVSPYQFQDFKTKAEAVRWLTRR